MPTTGGSVTFKNLQTPDDGFVVKKLRDAGAIIVAKANLHELARAGTTVSSLGGQTKNPYDANAGRIERRHRRAPSRPISACWGPVATPASRCAHHPRRMPSWDYGRRAV